MPAKKDEAKEAENTTAQDLQPEDKKEETVTISKNKLGEILKRVERLESASDKGRLQRYDDKNREEPEKKVRLITYNGKVVTGWGKMPKNTVQKNQRGVWQEDQQIRLYTEDGNKRDIYYIEFARNYVHLPAIVKAEKKLMDKDQIEAYGEVLYTVVTDDENQIEYEIGSKFIN